MQAVALQVAPVQFVGSQVVPVQAVALQVWPVQFVGLQVVPVQAVASHVVPLQTVAVQVVPVQFVGSQVVPVQAVALQVVPVQEVGSQVVPPLQTVGSPLHVYPDTVLLQSEAQVVWHVDQGSQLAMQVTAQVSGKHVGTFSHVAVPQVSSPGHVGAWQVSVPLTVTPHCSQVLYCPRVASPHPGSPHMVTRQVWSQVGSL